MSVSSDILCTVLWYSNIYVYSANLHKHFTKYMSVLLKMDLINIIVFCMTVCSYNVTYAFQSKSTLYSCLNVKELLARSRCEILSLSDCNWTRTHNRLVRKRTLNHLAKPLSVCFRTKWLWVRIQLQYFVCLMFFLQADQRKNQSRFLCDCNNKHLKYYFFD